MRNGRLEWKKIMVFTATCNLWEKRWVLTNGRLGFQRKIMGFECGMVD